MIKIYTSPNCSSCKKVKEWFDNEKIPYESKNIFGGSLTTSNLMEIITKSENGTDDIISTRSKIVQENNIDFDSLTISELIEFIKQNPSILKRPIIVDDHRIQVGYNEEEIRTFIPRARRIADLNCSKDCPKWAECDHAKDLID